MHNLIRSGVVGAMLLLFSGAASAQGDAPPTAEAQGVAPPAAEEAKPPDVDASAAVDVAPPGAGRPPPEPFWIRYLDRAFTAPAGLLIPYSVVGVARTGPNSDPGLLVDVGFAVGIIKNTLLFEADVVPLTLTPEVGYGNVRFGPVYQVVLSKQFELAAILHATINTYDFAAVNTTFGYDAIVDPGFRTFTRPADPLRIDVGVYVPIKVGDTTTAGLTAPVNVGVQFNRNVHAILNTGLTILDFDIASDTTFIPLGINPGFSFIAGEGIWVDINPYFVWPAFVQPSAEEKINSGFFVTGLATAVVFQAF